MTLRSTDYAALAQDSYKDPILNKTVPINGVDYRAIAFANDPRTGFQATAYEHINSNGSHEVVFAYRGTEFNREPVQDGATDAGMVVSAVNAQAPESEAFTKSVMAKANTEAEKNHYAVDFKVTGHSLGGTLAEINAYKFGLHGETFNAYGAAGLAMGIPSGGNQVIDNVKATDVVSAGSPHFGQVRTFATPQDIDHLHQAGYNNDSSILSPRNLVGEVKRDGGGAHGIANFAPDQNGQTIMTASNQALAHSNEGAISRYRNDVRDVRVGISMATGGEEAVLAVDGAIAAGHSLSKASAAAEQSSVRAYEATRETVVHEAHVVHDKAVEGLHATEHAAQYVGHEAHQGYDYTREKTIQAAHATEHAAQYVGHETVKEYNATVDAISRGIEATAHAGHQAYDATVNATSHGIEATVDGAKVVGHFGERVYDATVDATSRGMEDVTNFAKAHPIQLNHTSHPDNNLFQQAHDGVKKLDAAHGRASDHHSENLAGALTVEAKAQGLKRIDTVALSVDGSKAFAAQNVIPGAFKNVAGVETAQAVHIPIEQSTQQMTQVNQALPQHAQTQQQVQSQQQAAPVNPQQSSPTMTR